MNLGLKEREIDEIKILHHLFPQINQIIIFGSRARGDYNRTSDIDIAIT
ncbi:MAG: nucleotidyltransferase domain-containing protein, partial [Cetobacterium sp.]